MDAKFKVGQEVIDVRTNRVERVKEVFVDKSEPYYSLQGEDTMVGEYRVRNLRWQHDLRAR